MKCSTVKQIKVVHLVTSLVRYRCQKNPLLRFSCLQLKGLNLVTDGNS